MKTFSRISQLACMACALIPLSVACVDGSTGVEPEDGGPAGGDCAVDTDCTGDDFCHPYLLTCVANCVVETDACGSDTPVCNEEDADGNRPLPNADFNNVCVCDDTSCADGEVCSSDYGVCIPTCDATDAAACPDVGGEAQACYGLGDDNYCQPACTANTDCSTDAPICDVTSGQCLQGCTADTGLRVECGQDELCYALSGECFAGCVNVGEQDICGATEVCVPDGTCEEECDDTLCLNTQELCQYDALATESYNQCVSVEEAVDTACGSITIFDGIDREGDGPILIFATFSVDAGTYVIAIDYFDPDGDLRIGDLPAQYGADWEIACDGENCLANSFPPDDSGEGVFEGYATSGTVYLVKSMPAGLDQVAVQAVDAAGNLSNAVCVFPE